MVIQPVRDVIYKVNNVGEWVGENAMGQILTMVKLALHEGINMPIDENMLNEAKINWFGKVLHFTRNEDGRVSVEEIKGGIKRKKELSQKVKNATVVNCSSQHGTDR